MSEQQFIQVEIAPTFNKNIRKLAKKYHNIRNDIQPVIEQLELVYVAKPLLGYGSPT